MAILRDASSFFFLVRDRLIHPGSLSRTHKLKFTRGKLEFKLGRGVGGGHRLTPGVRCCVLSPESRDGGGAVGDAHDTGTWSCDTFLFCQELTICVVVCPV